MSEPLLIGLTGGIGSGKSTAAAELAALGAEVVSGDELGRQVLETSPQLLAQIRSRFGNGVFDSGGKLRRRALGDRVFANKDDARWLTHLTFPGIYYLWRQAVEKTTRNVLVFDAALIFEWGIEKDFDIVLIVQAARNQVIGRLSQSGRLNTSEIAARLASQISPELKAQNADIVLVNDGTLEEFRDHVHKFWTAQVEPELQRRSVRENGSSC